MTTIPHYDIFILSITKRKENPRMSNNERKLVAILILSLVLVLCGIMIFAEIEKNKAVRISQIEYRDKEL